MANKAITAKRYKSIYKDFTDIEGYVPSVIIVPKEEKQRRVTQQDKEHDTMKANGYIANYYHLSVRYSKGPTASWNSVK